MGWKKVILWAAGLFLALFVVFLPGFSDLQKLREERLDVQKRSEILKQNNEALKGEINEMQTDPRYVEQKARQKLGILMKGEFIYKPSPGGDYSTSKQETTGSSTKSKKPK